MFIIILPTLQDKMKIKLDMREPALYEQLNKITSSDINKEQIELISENLHLGDVVLTDVDSNNNEVILVIIERKSLSDLAMSIRDGRYNEQSFRLNNYPLPNHNIIYLIEGQASDYNNKYMSKSIKYNTLISAMASIQYFKGFSLYRTNNVKETAEYIFHYADKISREKSSGKIPYYNNVTTNVLNADVNLSTTTVNAHDTTEPDEKQSSIDYCKVIKKSKKNENITVSNIGEIMLMQIPGISSQSSISIMNKFKTIKSLVNCLENDKTCLDDICLDTKTSTGKSRRLTKSSINNIFKFMLQTDNDIQIST
jgi:crossover junction endonuclease MUS81